MSVDDHLKALPSKDEEISDALSSSFRLAFVNAVTVNAGKTCSCQSLAASDQKKQISNRFCSRREFGSVETLGSTENDEDQGSANLLDASRLFLLESSKSSSSIYLAPQFDKSLESLSTSILELHGVDVEEEEEEEVHHDTATIIAKKVTFSTVTIQEHPIIVGDNPGGTEGVPVTIAWERCNDGDVIFPLHSYESVRYGRSRSEDHLRMTKQYRNNLLKNLGFPLKERMEAEALAETCRKQRRKTNLQEKQDKRYERIETVTRGIQNIFSMGRKSAQEKKYLMHSLNVPLHTNTRKSILHNDLKASIK